MNVPIAKEQEKDGAGNSVLRFLSCKRTNNNSFKFLSWLLHTAI
jgi:hypothetical protein